MEIRDALKQNGFEIIHDDGSLLICKKGNKVCALSSSSNIIPVIAQGNVRGCVVLGTDGDTVSAIGPWGTVRASGN